jgi:transposase InsO family protein
MERALHGLSGKNVRVYFDDILITSDSWLDHLNNLRSVFERCRSAGLKLKPIKCRLVAKEIGFLGHKLTADGLQKDEGKVRAMKEFPTPNSLKQLRSFLGLIGYYRKFIPGFSTVAKPLLELQKSLLNGSDFNWNEACQESMTALIAKVCQDVTLQFPDFAAAQTEPARALIVQTDASRTGLGAILGQLDGKGKARPIYFASRACTPTEAKYSVTELEALALKFAVQKFAPFIIGLHTIVETDHSALVQMFNSPKECGSARVNKWAMLIKSQFDIEVRYRPGKSNANADALSRAFEPASASLVVWVANANPQGLVPHAISKDDWITAQIDGEFGDIYKFIDKRSLPPEVEKAQSVIGQMASFTLVDRVLFYVNPHTAELQLVVPTEFQHTVFHERHGGACGVHYSGRKIYLALKKQYYWPNMRADCERWVRSCPICAFTREPRLNIPPLQPIVAEAPFDLVCMDILQLGLTLKGHKYLFVCVDQFSKFVIAEPLQTKTAEEVATALLNRLILVHGAPRRLHSDKGKEFVNTVVERLVALLGTEQTTTAGYNPRANGAAERVNRELVRMLRRSCVVPQEWDDRVPFTVFAYNTTPHESTGESPYFIIHGRDANFPSAVDPGLVPRMYADAHGFKEMIAVNANEVAAKVRENLEKARALYKKYYDAHKKVFTEKYHVGQRVMVYDPKVDSSPTRKLHWQYYGPFRVIEIEGSNAKVRPLDKPHAKTEWLPLDRLGPIPDECVMKYEGKDARKRMLQKPVAEQHDTNTSREKAIQNPSGFKEFPVATASLCLAVAPSLPSATSEVLYTQTPVRSIETEEMEFLAKTYRSAHVAFLNEPLSHMFDGRDFECEMFSDVRSMGRLALNAQFADSVTEVLVTLPPADGVGYGEIIGAMLDHFARYPHVRFFVVPPPPIKNDAYESAITQLMRAFGTADHRNIVRLEHRLRTFYSVGWKAAGTSVDQFHSTADGRWTPVGRDTIYKFLDESMELHWPFRVGYKEHMREQRRRPRRTPPRDDHRPARYLDSPPRQRRRPNPPDRREIPRRVELSPPRLHERVPHRERYRERQSPPRLQASPPSTAPTTVAPTPAGPVPRPAQFTPLSPRALAAQLLDLDGIRLSDGEDDDPMTQEQR